MAIAWIERENIGAAMPVDARTVTWRGEADIGRKEQQPVKLWFRMYAAELFSLRFLQEG